MLIRLHGSGVYTQPTLFVFGCFIALIYHSNAQCTSTDSDTDTCYIHRSSAWTPSDLNMFQCDGQLKRCVVTCSGDDLSCSSGDLGLPIHIICPVNAVSCIIDCQSTKSCQGITIWATTSKYTEINLAATDAGKSMTVHSPGTNGGELSINLESTNADFYDSTIIAQQNSSAIHIDCDIGHLCTNNTIGGQRVEGEAASIALSCDSADCSHTNLYCSHDALIASQQASCSIDCQLCTNTNVYTVNGVLDPINWNCANSHSCAGSQLYCGTDQTNDFSLLIWDSIHTQWSYRPGIGRCGFLTTNPTASPIVPPTTLPSIAPTIHPTTTTDANAIDITRIRVIRQKHDTEDGTSLSSVIISMDPLYYVIFMLTLSLGCVVCILLFWMYHQRRFSKGFDDEEDSDPKTRHRNVQIASDGSILPLSPRILGLSTTSPISTMSSQVQYDAVSTASNHSHGNTNTTGSQDRDSIILEANTIFNPHHKKHKHRARDTMDTTATASDVNNNTSSASKSPSPPVPKAYNERPCWKSTPNVLNPRNANIKSKQFAMRITKTSTPPPPHPTAPLQNVYLSPISALSGVPTISDAYTYTYTTTTDSSSPTGTTITPKHRNTTTSTEEESESDESDEESDEDSESYTSSESESDESENTIDGVMVPLNYATQKSKFALPPQYKNMSISTSRNNSQRSLQTHDKISMNRQHTPPKMPIAPLPPSQLHNVPHSIPYKGTTQTLPLPVRSVRKHGHKHCKKHKKHGKHKKHKKKKKKRDGKGSRHRKKGSGDTITFGKKNRHSMNLSIATSIISELTELTEGTEDTEMTEMSSQPTDADIEMTRTTNTNTEESYSSQAIDGLSTIASSEYTDSSCSSDGNTEFTQTLTTTTPSGSGSNSSESEVSTEQDGYPDNETYREQSKTINSRITRDGTMKEITIKSEVLDADIMVNLYDNKIKPLGLSGMINALQDEYDENSSSSAPSPQSVTL